MSTILKIIILLIVCVSFSLVFHPPMYDWVETYRPSIIALIHGQNPYQSYGLIGPPWILLPLLPIALLPEWLSSGAMVALNIFLLFYISRKFGGNTYSTIALLCSYPAYRLIIHGQIDALVMVGYFLPPWLGLFFMLAKPQIGIGLIFYWFYIAWKKEGISRVARWFGPVSIAMGITFAIFGVYYARGLNVLHREWNTTMWPYSIPLGIYLLYSALKLRDEKQAVISSPFLSPYVTYYSWIAPLSVIVQNPKSIALVSLATWVVVPIAKLPLH